MKMKYTLSLKYCAWLFLNPLVLVNFSLILLLNKFGFGHLGKIISKNNACFWTKSVTWAKMKCKIKSALKFIPMSQIMVLTLTALYSRWPGPHNFTREETGVSWNKLDMPTFTKCNGTGEKKVTPTQVELLNFGANLGSNLKLEVDNRRQKKRWLDVLLIVQAETEAQDLKPSY